jgi:hypothetical protein
VWRLTACDEPQTARENLALKTKANAPFVGSGRTPQGLPVRPRIAVRIRKVESAPTPWLIAQFGDWDTQRLQTSVFGVHTFNFHQHVHTSSVPARLFSAIIGMNYQVAATEGKAGDTVFIGLDVPTERFRVKPFATLQVGHARGNAIDTLCGQSNLLFSGQALSRPA